MSAPLLHLQHEINPVSKACIIFFLAGFVSAIPADSFSVALCGALPALCLPLIVITAMQSGHAGSGDAGMAAGFALVASFYTVLSAAFGSACGYIFREVIWGKPSKEHSTRQGFRQRMIASIILGSISVASMLIH